MTIHHDAPGPRDRRLVSWLCRQRAYVTIAQALGNAPHPAADGRNPEGVRVVTDDGAVYRGDKAWMVCLWALRRHRAAALRLAARGSPESAYEVLEWLAFRGRVHDRSVSAAEER
jgi:hypothetical protein